ncbi:MAG: hypothetical protein H6905_05635 [Hyphomicrobiales bacterium]|nr:hypothetical protein [Hyphomicrobiales bacterium]
MRVMFDVTDPGKEMHTMTKVESKTSRIDVKELLAVNGELLRTLMRWGRRKVNGRRRGWAIAAAPTRAR